MTPTPAAIAYESIAAEWQEITRGFLHPVSGRCCERVDGCGAPECCYQLLQGAQLTFTENEVQALADIFPSHCEPDGFRQREDGIWVYRDDLLSMDEHRYHLNGGWMAETIECSSHPLRPIVGQDDVVLGTVAVNACNTQRAIDTYREKRDEIRDLWQETVDAFGVKPYYANHYIKADWIVL